MLDQILRPDITVWLCLSILHLTLVKVCRYWSCLQLKQNGVLHGHEVMSLDDAYKITMNLATVEFPTVFIYGIRFGMFKSYAIPSITKLLAQTGHFNDLEKTSRRAADTGALLAEIFFHPPSDERAQTAIARTDFLHSGYRKSNRITNDDMLYTHALSILQTITWINKYEWRRLSVQETNAMAVWWKHLGSCLHVSFNDLEYPEHASCPAQQWLSALQAWVDGYERSHMMYAESNALVASNALKLLTRAERIAARCFIEDNRCKALGLSRSSHWLNLLVKSALHLRRYIVRHLFLPRFRPVRMTATPSTTKSGHYCISNGSWSMHPWYVRPVTYSRFNPSRWIRWSLGRASYSGSGSKYMPDGFDPFTIGPAGLVGKGHSYMAEEKAWLHSKSAGICPCMVARGA